VSADGRSLPSSAGELRSQKAYLVVAGTVDSGDRVGRLLHEPS